MARVARQRLSPTPSPVVPFDPNPDTRLASERDYEQADDERSRQRERSRVYARTPGPAPIEEPEPADDGGFFDRLGRGIDRGIADFQEGQRRLREAEMSTDVNAIATSAERATKGARGVGAFLDEPTPRWMQTVGGYSHLSEELRTAQDMGDYEEVKRILDRQKAASDKPPGTERAEEVGTNIYLRERNRIAEIEKTDPGRAIANAFGPAQLGHDIANPFNLIGEDFSTGITRAAGSLAKRQVQRLGGAVPEALGRAGAEVAGAVDAIPMRPTEGIRTERVQVAGGAVDEAGGQAPLFRPESPEAKALRLLEEERNALENKPDLAMTQEEADANIARLAEIYEKEEAIHDASRKRYNLSEEITGRTAGREAIPGNRIAAVIDGNDIPESFTVKQFKDVYGENMTPNPHDLVKGRVPLDAMIDKAADEAGMEIHDYFASIRQALDDRKTTAGLKAELLTVENDLAVLAPPEPKGPTLFKPRTVKTEGGLAMRQEASNAYVVYSGSKPIATFAMEKAGPKNKTQVVFRFKDAQGQDQSFTYMGLKPADIKKVSLAEVEANIAKHNAAATARRAQQAASEAGGPAGDTLPFGGQPGQKIRGFSESLINAGHLPDQLKAKIAENPNSYYNITHHDEVYAIAEEIIRTDPAGARAMVMESDRPMEDYENVIGMVLLDKYQAAGLWAESLAISEKQAMRNTRGGKGIAVLATLGRYSPENNIRSHISRVMKAGGDIQVTEGDQRSLLDSLNFSGPIVEVERKPIKAAQALKELDEIIFGGQRGALNPYNAEGEIPAEVMDVWRARAEQIRDLPNGAAKRSLADQLQAEVKAWRAPAPKAAPTPRTAPTAGEPSAPRATGTAVPQGRPTENVPPYPYDQGTLAGGPAAGTSPLTREAQDLLAKADQGSVPAFVSNSFERILKDNGISQADINSKAPIDLLDMLRAKVGAPQDFPSGPAMQETLPSNRATGVSGQPVPSQRGPGMQGTLPSDREVGVSGQPVAGSNVGAEQARNLGEFEGVRGRAAGEAGGPTQEFPGGPGMQGTLETSPRPQMDRQEFPGGPAMQSTMDVTDSPPMTFSAFPDGPVEQQRMINELEGVPGAEAGAAPMGEVPTSKGATQNIFSNFDMPKSEKEWRDLKKQEERIIRKYKGSNKVTPESLKVIRDRSLRIKAMPPGQERMNAQAELLRDMDEVIPRTIAAKLNGGQAFGMIATVKNLLGNVEGNLTHLAMENLTQSLMATADAARVAVMGGQRSVLQPRMGAQVKAGPEGLKRAIREATTGITQGQSLNRYEVAPGRTFPISFQDIWAEGLTETERLKRIPEAALHYLEVAARLAILIPDRTVFQMKKAGAATERSILAAEASGLRGEAKAAEELKHLLKPTLEEDMADNAAALVTTFNEDSLTAMVSVGLRDLLNTIPIVSFGKTHPIGIPFTTRTLQSHEYGPGQMFMRFAQVPATLIQKGWEYSPMGITNVLYEILKLQAKNPKLGPASKERVAGAAARLLVGGAVVTPAGFLAAEAGFLTGATPDDPKQRMTWALSGKKPGQLNLSAAYRWLASGGQKQKDQHGDELLDITKLPPFSFPFLMGATISEHRQERAHKQQEDEAYVPGNPVWDFMTGVVPETARESAIAATSLLGDQSLTQFTDVFRNSPADAPWTPVANLMSRVPASFIPALMNNVTQLLDNTVYETRSDSFAETMANNLMARVPGLGALYLSPRIDVRGENQTRYTPGDNTFWNTMISPMAISEYQPSLQTEALEDIYRRTGLTTPMFQPAERSVTITDPETHVPVKYSLTQQAQAMLQKSMGQKVNEAYGRLAADPLFQKETPYEQAYLMNKVQTALNGEAMLEIRRLGQKQPLADRQLPPPPPKSSQNKKEMSEKNTAEWYRAYKLIDQYKSISKVAAADPKYRRIVAEVNALPEGSRAREQKESTFSYQMYLATVEARRTKMRSNRTLEKALQEWEGYKPVNSGGGTGTSSPSERGRPERPERPSRPERPTRPSR